MTKSEQPSEPMIARTPLPIRSIITGAKSGSLFIIFAALAVTCPDHLWGKTKPTKSSKKGQQAAVPANVEATVTQLGPGRAAYRLQYDAENAMLLSADGIQIGNDGTWTRLKAGMIDFSPSYREKKYAFKGSTNEFVSLVGVKKNSEGRLEADFGTRVVTAAHLNYDPLAAKPTSLSGAGVVTIANNGFVEGHNAKSGWVNMPASFSFEENGRERSVRMEGITFWVNESGSNWLSFAVKRVTISDGQAAPWTEVAVETRIVGADGQPKAVADLANGSAILVIGQRRFRAKIKDITDPLAFAEESTASSPGK